MTDAAPPNTTASSSVTVKVPPAVADLADLAPAASAALTDVLGHLGPPGPKPGYLTTEFWVTLLTHVVAVLTLFVPRLAVGQWVQPLAVIAAGVATAAYAISRAHVKHAHLVSSAAR